MVVVGLVSLATGIYLWATSGTRHELKPVMS